MKSLFSSVNILKFLLLISLSAKFSFLGKGMYSNLDENRYMASQNAIEFLSKADVLHSIEQLHAAQARPGYILIGMIPAAVQIKLANFLLLPYNHPSVLWVPYIFNFFVFLLVVYLIYKISVLLKLTKETSLAIALLYSVSTNAYLYIRHMLPYDLSLLLVLMAFFTYLKMAINNVFSFKSLTAYGFLVSFAFAVYPSYFMAYVGLYVLLLMTLLKLKNHFACFKKLLISVITSICVFLIFQMSGAFVGKSYLNDALNLSSTVRMGEFDEVPLFVFRYFLSVEGLFGVVVMILLLLGFYFIFKQAKNKSLLIPDHVIRINTVFVGLILLFVLQGYFLHKMVFMGRLLHQFYPFWLILAGISLQIVLNRLTTKNSVKTGLIFFVCFLNIFNHNGYRTVEYAEHITEKIKKQGVKYHSFDEYCEWDSSLSPIKDVKYFSEILDSSSNLCLRVENWCFTRTDIMLNPKLENPLPKGGKVIIDVPHWISFPAYQFEGAGPIQRAHFKNNPRRIRVVQLECKRL